MGGDGGLSDGLATGGKVAGGALLLLAAVRLFIFVCNFLAGRYDARQDRLDDREQRVDRSYAARLTHLERLEIENKARIGLLEEAVGVLTAELRQLDPNNEKLSDVAKLLRGAISALPPRDPDLDALIGRIK